MTHLRIAPAVLGAALIAITAACSSTQTRGAVPAPTSAAPAPNTLAPSSPPSTTAVSSTTRPAPTTSSSTSSTSTTVVPALPAPPPIHPLVAPPYLGEGVWHPAGDRLPGGYAMYITTLRSAPGVPPTGVAWIDESVTRFALYAGSGQPYGSWPNELDVNASLQPSLLAAFNSGFKIYSYHTGWYESGVAAMPLQPGAASLVIFSNGTATVGEWGRDVSAGPTVTAVRQNLTLLVDGGAPTPAAQVPGDWGAVLGGGWVTWRSAIGVTGSGALVYAGGPGLTPSLLAGVMVAAGAVRAMELDINPDWVSYAVYTHAGGIGHGSITGTNLLNGMYFGPDHYLTPAGRDFIAVFSR